MMTTKELTGLAAIGSCSENTIAKYARFACAIHLHNISELLQKSSVTLDMPTHMSRSYLDIQTRLHLENTGIVNLHLLEIPTGQVIFEVASTALDILCDSWRDMLIGISTDGEKKISNATECSSVS